MFLRWDTDAERASRLDQRGHGTCVGALAVAGAKRVLSTTCIRPSGWIRSTWSVSVPMCVRSTTCASGDPDSPTRRNGPPRSRATGPRSSPRSGRNAFRRSRGCPTSPEADRGGREPQRAADVSDAARKSPAPRRHASSRGAPERPEHRSRRKQARARERRPASGSPSGPVGTRSRRRPTVQDALAPAGAGRAVASRERRVGHGPTVNCTRNLRRRSLEWGARFSALGCRFGQPAMAYFPDAASSARAPDSMLGSP